MTPPWMPAKGPKTKRLAEARLKQLLFHGTFDDESFLEVARRQIPDAWTTLEMDLDVDEPKEKVTLYLDRSVARMFRSMGKGYHARINRLLATWVQMKIAEKVELEKDMLEAIEQADSESRATGTTTEMAKGRKKLHEHWAYAQGQLDALAGLETAGEKPDQAMR